MRRMDSQHARRVSRETAQVVKRGGHNGEGWGMSVQWEEESKTFIADPQRNPGNAELGIGQDMEM